MTKIINGLKAHQAIKVGNNYLVELGNQSYVVNDREVVGNYNGVQILVTEDDIKSILRVERPIRELIHYVDESGNKVDKDVVQSKRAILGNYVDEDGDYCFPDLDTEYKVRKEVEPYNNLKPVYSEPEAKLVPVSIDIVGEHEETGSKFITTPYIIGEAKFSGGGLYSVDETGVLWDEFNKIIKNNPNWKVDIPNHSQLEYIKINGKYVFTNNSGRMYKTKTRKCFVSKDDAIGHEANLRSDIKRKIAGVMVDVELNLAEINNVVAKIKSIKTSLLGVETKQKTYSSYQSTLRNINELLTNLENIAENKL